MESSTAHQANPALAELHDIIPPPPIGTWPWATGYWLILGLTIVVLIVIGRYFYQRARRLAPKKQALLQLAQLNLNAPNYAFDVNELLKRTALSYCARADIAHLEGDAWGDWLDLSLPPNLQRQLGPLLAKRYQATPLTPDEARTLAQLANVWLKAKVPLPAPNIATRNSVTPTHDLSEAQC